MPGVVFELTEPELRFEAAGGTQVARTVHPSGLRVLTERVPGGAVDDDRILDPGRVAR